MPLASAGLLFIGCLPAGIAAHAVPLPAGLEIQISALPGLEHVEPGIRAEMLHDSSIGNGFAAILRWMYPKPKRQVGDLLHKRAKCSRRGCISQSQIDSLQRRLPGRRNWWRPRRRNKSASADTVCKCRGGVSGVRHGVRCGSGDPRYSRPGGQRYKFADPPRGKCELARSLVEIRTSGSLAGHFAPSKTSLRAKLVSRRVTPGRRDNSFWWSCP